MRAYRPASATGWTDVPPQKWPRAIAGLKPESVTVFGWGVDVVTKSGLDGGWGYQVPRRGADLPMPAGCYDEPVRGIFRHGPC